MSTKKDDVPCEGCLRNSKTSQGKTPTFQKDGKKWLIEHQKGNRHLVVENVEMNNVVYVYDCVDSTVTVRGKVNSIVLDSCRKTSLIFDSVVASVEFVNSRSVKMQVFGKVPTITVDKTDGCQMFISRASQDVEIISSKSTEMNVHVPDDTGDYLEYAVPEQFKTVILANLEGLKTQPVENASGM